MPKFTVTFEEVVVSQTEIEAATAEEAAKTAAKMVNDDVFPNDMPERQSAKILVRSASNAQEDDCVELELN